MTENFEFLEVGQIELMHDQVHGQLGEDADCDKLRMQHDSLAAELVKRGIVHDTEVVCLEVDTNAPNYRRGFTDDVCTQCAFGQLFPLCNLYKFDYLKGYTCDSFRYFEVLELEPPHGFLMAQGKQIAIASDKQFDKETSQVRVVVSNGEAFGIAVLDEPAQIKAKEFDSEEWLNQHRVTPRERRQWWPGVESFYVYRLKEWHPYEGVKLYENGQVISEPKLTAKQWQLVSKAKELPKQIVLLNDAISITENEKFIFDPQVYNLSSSHLGKMDKILKAAYEIDGALIYKDADAKEIIPIYSLALVRNPRMRVSKKNVIIEGEKGQSETENKQEDEIMSFRIRKCDDEYCVVKIESDDSDGDAMGCHQTESEAQDQLTALNINVTAEEGKNFFGNEESEDEKLNFIRRQFENQFNPNDNEEHVWVTDIFKSFLIADEVGQLFRVDYMIVNNGVIFSSKDKWVEAERGYRPKGFKHLISFNSPRVEPPKAAKKAGFIEGLRNVAKSIGDFLNLAETEEKRTKLFVNDAGIGQKVVNGEVWHFTYSTNAFEDREGEIFSTKSLEDYVANNEINDDKGFFNLWHINEENGNFNTDFARKQWQGVVGRFLVEAGPYLKNEKGRAAKEFFKSFENGHSEIAPGGWGCSPEFRYLPEERASGTYENIWITRTSTLPKFAAANVWTETRQLKRGNKMALSEQQMKAAVEVFGDEIVNNLIQEAESKTVELEDANVAHKGEGGIEQSEPQEIQLNMEELAQEVGKQFTANLTPIAEAMATMASSLKKMEDRLGKVEKTKQIGDKTETPRFIFNMQRASEQDETIVTDDDGLKDRGPKEAQANDGDAWSQIFNK